MGEAAAAAVLLDATATGLVRGASLYVRSGESVFARAFGAAPSPDAAFLLGSISKPIVVAALLSLYDTGLVDLDAPAYAYLPEFTGDGRERVSVRHLLTHTSGLPDQVPENATLRANHAPLSAFVEATFPLPLAFTPGSQYLYSSMAILLAAEIAQRLSGQPLAALVAERVFAPLGMRHSALGNLVDVPTMPCQIEYAAPEAGAGAPGTERWNWNSPYWRALGAPWGGVQARAADVARFLDAFVAPVPGFLSAETASVARRNHNAAGLPPRGLGFDLDMGVSPETFGHTGSTGTIAWTDPSRDLTCVVLTTLPWRAVTPHPAQRAAALIAAP